MAREELKNSLAASQKYLYFLYLSVAACQRWMIDCLNDNLLGQLTQLVQLLK